jgi:hypothetical protein
VGAGVVMLSPFIGQAAEWSLEPSMSAKGEYNSNLLMVLGPQRATHSYWLSPGVKFAGSTESLYVSGKAAADFIQYFGGRDTVITNVYAPLSLQYRGERNTWAFDGGLTRDNTLRSELLQTGLVLAFAQRNLWAANPSWTYHMTERWSMQSGYQFQDAQYEAGTGLGLVDYRVHGGTAGLSYRVNESDSIQLSGTYSKFLAPQGNHLVSDSYGVQLKGIHAFSERTTATVEGGPRFLINSIETGSLARSDHKTVWVFKAGLSTRTERTQFSLDLSREIFPSGFGLLIQTDRAGATVRHEVTDKLALSLNAGGYLVKGVFSTPGAPAALDSRYLTVTPTVTWRFNEWWTAEAGYTFARRDDEGVDQAAINNMGRVMVTYSPTKLSIGR